MAAPVRILRMPELSKKVGLKPSAIREAVRQGRFPAPLKLTPRACGWIEAEIDEWIAARPRARPVRAAAE